MKGDKMTQTSEKFFYKLDTKHIFLRSNYKETNINNIKTYITIFARPK